MHICGIVSEYNPFHNGHEYHIWQTRQKTVADFIICVMSGHFVQRGQPAIFDKWTRAVCAVRAGADAVIELPLLSAVQSAEGFAAGSVAMLCALGADGISFGCETDDIIQLSSIAKTLSKESRSFRRTLKQQLSDGRSFATARMRAAFPNAPKEASMPNAILAIEYLKAIYKSKAKLEPVAVKRIGQSYHSDDCSTHLSSATAIRSAWKENRLECAYASMPQSCAAYLRQQIDLGLVPVFADQFDRELIYRLRLGGVSYIKSLHDVSEGLENRIFEAAKTCTTRQQIVEAVKTKRYTYTRISRIMTYALLGITREMIVKHNRTRPDHVRVLAVKNPDVLSALSKTSRVPVVTGAVASSRYPGMDAAATAVYALSQTTVPFCSASADYTQKLIVDP